MDSALFEKVAGKLAQNGDLEQVEAMGIQQVDFSRKPKKNQPFHGHKGHKGPTIVSYHCIPHHPTYSHWIPHFFMSNMV